MAGETYQKRYVGGFHDQPATTTPVDSQFLNAVETALLYLLGADPTDKAVQVWDSVLARFKTALIKDENISASAAIAKSKLASLAIVDSDVAPGAAIASSKIAGNFPISKLFGFPNLASKFLRGDGTWGDLIAATITGAADKTSAAVQIFTGALSTGPSSGAAGQQGVFAGTNGEVRAGASSAIGVFLASLVGDAVSRFLVQADGVVKWGDGTNPVDTTLSRIGASLLQLAGGLTATGKLLTSSPTSGYGYDTGAGGAVTQITSQTTAVTLNKLSGVITMFSGFSLANLTAVTFTLNNSTVGINDGVIPTVQGTDAGSFLVSASVSSAGVVKITLYNVSGGTVNTAPVISFQVARGVNS